MSHESRRRYRKTSDRRVWVFRELNEDLTADKLANVIARAALDQARLERDAQLQHEVDLPACATATEGDL